MRDKLQKLITAYEELEKRLYDPSVVSDPKEYARLAKERSGQTALVEKAREAFDTYEKKLESIEERRKYGEL